MPATSSLAAVQRYVAQRVQGIMQNQSLRPLLAPPEILSAALAYPKAGGKSLRPVLTFLACRTFGGNEEAALRVGAAIELYHTYTLVHDDIIDRDALRRGQPSVHTLMAQHGEDGYHLPASEAAHYGMSMAILTGDIQQSWAIALLCSLREVGISADISLSLIQRLQGEIGPCIVEGEALDIQLPYLPVTAVTTEMILRVIRTKTAALFAFCAWAGGMLAHGQETEQVTMLTQFAEYAGIAFQLQDDILGLIGSESKLGKPVGNDLREGKRTLLIALAWERATAGERDQLSAVLGNPHASSREITGIAKLLDRLEVINEVQTLAADYLARALHYLETLPENQDIIILREMAQAMLQREK